MTVPTLRGFMSPAAPTSEASPLLVLLPSLGTTTDLWDGVVARLAASPNAPRILRVDLPGHGASPVTREPLSVSDVAAGVLTLVDEAGGGAFHVAGDSLGGAIALELAIVAPDRVLGLAMFCSGSRIGTAESWAQRAAQVRASGTASVVAGSAQRWFAPGYLDAHPDGPGSRALSTLMDVDDESYARCCEALGAFDRAGSLAEVQAPALIVAGGHDPVCTPGSVHELAASLPDARFVELPGASHLVPLEDPDATAALLTDHIHAQSVYGRGMATRRAVLGDEHVDRAIAAITPETADFQDFITRYAWAEIWTRPQLTRAQRSIATLASLVTGGHENELRMHVSAALRNGLTRTEIAEVIHHTALYAGLPAANAALAAMREVFAEQSDEPATEPGTEPEENDG